MQTAFKGKKGRWRVRVWGRGAPEMLIAVHSRLSGWDQRHASNDKAIHKFIARLLPERMRYL